MALKQHYVLFETGGRNVEESAPHWRHVSHLSWLNAPSYNRFVYVTGVPGGTLASLALRGRQQKQDETRRVKLLYWTCIVMVLCPEQRSWSTPHLMPHFPLRSHRGRADGCLHADGPTPRRNCPGLGMGPPWPSTSDAACASFGIALPLLWPRLKHRHVLRHPPLRLPGSATHGRYKNESCRVRYVVSN